MSEKVKQTGLSGYMYLAGTIQAAAFSIPFGAARRPSWFFLFPPIGELHQYIIPLSAALVAVASVFPWFLVSIRTAKRVAFTSIVILIVSFCLYVVGLSFRVVSFKDVMRGTAYTFSIGATKSEIAIETFGENCEKQDKLIRELGSECDVAMIMAVGPTQQTVNTLWTKASLFQTHMHLLVSYLSCLICFNLFVGSTAKAAQIQATKS